MTMPSTVLAERGANVGLISLNRPEALNALSLEMIAAITQALLQWRDDPQVHMVVLRGSNKAGAVGTPERWFGHFCAGGDIRFFHDAAKAGDSALDDFFTQEYTLNHLIQTYAKPIVAFMDGVVMGGGMGLCQGIALRIVTEKTKMAMPETKIGLFPDVGGGHFLSRCPGAVGEYLALTGQVIGADAAIAYGLADARIAASEQASLWQALSDTAFTSSDQALSFLSSRLSDTGTGTALAPILQAAFSLPDVAKILAALDASTDELSQQTAAALRERSPLMLHVTLEQIRRARSMGLADELRMEWDMVWRCFHHRPVADSETVEGIRALAVDKDHQPRWKPARIADVDAAEVAQFFLSPVAPEAHPLRHLR
ncbi:MAG: enoyl-CoA hydratase/isomerase family protein [Betaproteobacteria bacterium]